VVISNQHARGRDIDQEPDPPRNIKSTFIEARDRAPLAGTEETPKYFSNQTGRFVCGVDPSAIRGLNRVRKIIGRHVPAAGARHVAARFSGQGSDEVDAPGRQTPRDGEPRNVVAAGGGSKVLR